MDNPTFKSDLFYSVQNEDYQTELTLLHRINPAEPLHLLMIASSGENVLSLLTLERVAAIEAVDINLAQLHLCELRRTAIEHLNRDEQLRLLGADPALPWAEDEAERLALYDRLRPHLSEACRSFWDARRDQDIAFGLHHVGRNDVGMDDIQREVAAAGFAPLVRPLTEAELPAWTAVYTGLMTSGYIQTLFGLPSEALGARIAGMADHLGLAHGRALQQPHPERDPYVTTVLANSYATAAGEAGLPLYLQEEGQASLRRLGTQERLRLHQGNLLEQMASLATTYGLFDLISLSNIADWMNEAQFEATVLKARDGLRPGGALLARMAANDFPMAEVMSRHLQVEPTLNTELLRIERGPWWRNVAAGFRGD